MMSAVTLASLGLWMGILYTVAVIIVITADGSVVEMATVGGFATMFIVATLWTHFLLELRLWKKTQWHLFIAIPAVCIGLWFLLSGQIFATCLWFFLLFTTEVCSIKWIVPLADWCYDRWLRQPDFHLHHSSHSLPLPHLPTKAVSSHPFQQRWHRFFDAEGNDTIEWEVAVSFQPHERQTSIHLPFIPPFERPPHIEMEPITELVEVEFVPVQLYSYGVKILAKRTGNNDQPQVIPVMVVATAARQIP